MTTERELMEAHRQRMEARAAEGMAASVEAELWELEQSMEPVKLSDNRISQRGAGEWHPPRPGAPVEP